MTAPQIHPSAIIAETARIADDVVIGPFSVVGPDVVLAKGVKLHSHVVVEGHTEIGEGTEVFSFAVLGSPPQDLKYKGEPSQLIIRLLYENSGQLTFDQLIEKSKLDISKVNSLLLKLNLKKRIEQKDNIITLAY